MDVEELALMLDDFIESLYKTFANIKRKKDLDGNPIDSKNLLYEDEFSNQNFFISFLNRDPKKNRHSKRYKTYSDSQAIFKLIDAAWRIYRYQEFFLKKEKFGFD